LEPAFLKSLGELINGACATLNIDLVFKKKKKKKTTSEVHFFFSPTALAVRVLLS
jgi:hypothetical protein